ncbi:MAG: DUF484 family protein [Alphaproteobacteria bacterium]|jgi:hypothetical protein|nr:DUF484 family protein [Alphaproteobacteria bacterium]MDP6812110.1 DUF484 family protein [Alphaproteobacteria bacterium]
MATKPMNPDPRPRQEAAPTEADTVRDFLAANPDFLAANPDLLQILRLPVRHGGENVLDMGQIMVRRLQEEVGELGRRYDDLLAAGRANQAAQGRMHDAALAMLEAKGFEHLIHIVTRDLPQVLDVDTVTLCVEATADDGPRKAPMGGVYVLEAGAVDALMGEGTAVHLDGDSAGDRRVFGPAAGLVRSQALVRLSASPGAPPGLLALGSRDGARFQPGQGTELLGFLARLLERLLQAWLDLPA